MKKIYFIFIFQIVILNTALSQNKVTLREDGIILVNNKPFFPNGLYINGWNQPVAKTIADIKEIGKAGFNLVQTNGWGSEGNSSEALGQVLDAASNAGLRVFVDGFTIYPATKAVSGISQGLNCRVNLVNKYKNHPALLGWVLADDSHDRVSVEDLKWLHSQLKANDPDHLSISVVYNTDKWDAYWGITDLTNPYSYPVGNGKTISDVDRRFNIAFNKNKPMLGIPQAYSWDYTEAKAPTSIEYQNMAYQTLINNVKGIIPFAYREGADDDNYIPRWTNLWNAVKLFKSEVDFLSPIFIQYRFNIINTGFNRGSGVQGAFWEKENSAFILLVNTNNTSSYTLNLKIPTNTIGNISTVFSSKSKLLSYNTATQVLSGQIAAGEVLVYKIESITKSESIEKEMGINLYPNPANEELHIANAPIGAAINICDISGRVLISEKIVSENQSINISSLAQGMYITKVGEVIKKIKVW